MRLSEGEFVASAVAGYARSPRSTARSVPPAAGPPRGKPLARHSKIAVTMEICTEAPSEATRDALRKLSDWLT
jgi:hypothetical protein